MITVGLDFGTHQSKVCIEFKEGAELNYKFFTFKDYTGKERYTLPSIIKNREDGLLEYGYLGSSAHGNIIRYFKQATFTTSEGFLSQKEAIHYSIWYLAYILFDLEQKYKQSFAIQMGVPTDGEHYKQQKCLAVRLITSAYHLVEDVFGNDKELFLNTPKTELVSLTKFLPYDEEKKEEFSILVFPEAYACLMPLVKSSKIANGMSLMIDIGGGTTDISFFTIKNQRPQVYAFYSIDKGLNFLTDAISRSITSVDSNVQYESSILRNRKNYFKMDITKVHDRLISRLKNEFRKQSDLDMHRLTDALKSRPIIYTGGGSTFQTLRLCYGGFKDVIPVSEKEWTTEAVSDIAIIKTLGLCPILSTAYGLSISVVDDDIKCDEQFADIFRNIRTRKGKKNKNTGATNKQLYTDSYSQDKFSYYDDYDAWK